MSATPPRFSTLADFLAAHARGDIYSGCQVVRAAKEGAVEIVGRSIVDAEPVVLFRAEDSDDFVMEFAAALGLEGVIS